tara:strand:- start:95938 stop:96210 length:273 start_codon:yes stop_codon:yes gene_type:complete
MGVVLVRWQAPSAVFVQRGVYTVSASGDVRKRRARAVFCALLGQRQTATSLARLKETPRAARSARVQSRKALLRACPGSIKIGRFASLQE